MHRTNEIEKKIFSTCGQSTLYGYDYFNNSFMKISFNELNQINETILALREEENISLVYLPKSINSPSKSRSEKERSMNVMIYLISASHFCSVDRLPSLISDNQIVDFLWLT